MQSTTPRLRAVASKQLDRVRGQYPTGLIVVLSDKGFIRFGTVAGHGLDAMSRAYIRLEHGGFVLPSEVLGVVDAVSRDTILYAARKSRGNITWAQAQDVLAYLPTYE
jgi:hypothetical protein